MRKHKDFIKSLKNYYPIYPPYSPHLAPIEIYFGFLEGIIIEFKQTNDKNK